MIRLTLLFSIFHLAVPLQMRRTVTHSIELSISFLLFAQFECDTCIRIDNDSSVDVLFNCQIQYQKSESAYKSFLLTVPKKLTFALIYCSVARFKSARWLIEVWSIRICG